MSPVDLPKTSATAVEQAELRKRSLESVAQAQARRAAEAPVSVEHPPDKRWQPPPEARGNEGGLRILFRLLVFGLLVAGLYVFVREVSHRLFGTRLVVVDGAEPGRRVVADETSTLGIRVANTGRTSAAAFAVASLASGVELEGPALDVRPGDTVFLPVEVRLPRGDHVVSLQVFDAAANAARIGAVHGLRVSAGPLELPVRDAAVPSFVERGSPFSVHFTVTNPGRRTEAVTPVVILRGAAGRTLAARGATTRLEGGADVALEVTVATLGVAPGPYVAELSVRNGTGETIGRSRYPIPLDITP